VPEMHNIDGRFGCNVDKIIFFVYNEIGIYYLLCEEKTMKKLLISLVSVFTVCLSLALVSSAEWSVASVSGHCGNGVMFFFTPSDGVLTFSGNGEMKSYSPRSAPWFSERDLIKTVKIGEGVTSIGNSAFYGCNNITQIDIPSTVTSIGEMAFLDCERLAEFRCAFDNPSFYVKDGILYFDKGYGNVSTLVCFPPAKNVTEFKIPSKVRHIDHDAFSGCTQLLDIEISSSVASIGKNAFMGCTGLTRIVIPSNVETVGACAFFGCTGMKSVKIENGVEKIYKYAFQNCSSLESVTLPSSLTVISEGTFSGCHNLRRVEIPSSVTTIESVAFFECLSLESIYIPSSVRQMTGFDSVGCYYEDVDGWLSSRVVEGFEIYGHKGSTAEAYAKESSIKFVEVSNSMQSFVKSVKYPENNFADIEVSKWYYPNVVSAYEYALMNGKSENEFVPAGNITVAEAITVAARINHIYRFGTSESLTAAKGEMWYTPYVEYAKHNGILTEDYDNYNVPATRAQFAKILSYALASNCFEAKNNIPDKSIPDVDMKSNYADSVYLLYRAGVLTGSDSAGRFNPDSTVTRAEAAAILTRIVDINLRKSLNI